MPLQQEEKIKAILFSPNGKNEAFKRMVMEYKEMVYFSIRRLVLGHSDADDLAQEVFIKVWESLDGFRNEASLKTWIYKIAINQALQFLRKKKQLASFRYVSLESQLVESLESDTYFEGNEIEQALQKAILRLPEKQRVTFQLRYFDELPFAEISEITGKSVGSLKANYHHAKQKIETRLNLLLT